MVLMVWIPIGKNARMNLDDIQVATPCHEPWERMTGDDRMRHCSKCALNVFNLSAMSKQEALDFVRTKQGLGRVCIRFHRRFDGTVITQDCPVGVRKRQLRILGMATAGVATVAALVTAMFSVRPSGRGGGKFREVYEGARDRVLGVGDDISHKFNMPSLCNCKPAPVVGHITMGMMVAPLPRSMPVTPIAPGAGGGAEGEDPFVLPDRPKVMPAPDFDFPDDGEPLPAVLIPTENE